MWFEPPTRQHAVTGSPECLTWRKGTTCSHWCQAGPYRGCPTSRVDLRAQHDQCYQQIDNNSNASSNYLKKNNSYTMSFIKHNYYTDGIIIKACIVWLLLLETWKGIITCLFLNKTIVHFTELKVEPAIIKAKTQLQLKFAFNIFH